MPPPPRADTYTVGSTKQDKRDRFVDEYLVDLNATQAYLRSHPKVKNNTARTEGARLLADPDIQKKIQDAKASRSKRTRITQDRVLRELARLGFSDIRDFANWENASEIIEDEERGETHEILTPSVSLKNSKALSLSSARAVAEVSNTAHGVKIKLHSKVRALEMLSRHTGLFEDLDEGAARAISNFADLVARARALKKGK